MYWFITLLLLLIQEGTANQKDENVPEDPNLQKIREGIQSADRDIVFWGKIVDQNNAPVPDADVRVGYRHYDSERILGNSDATFRSDAEGIFHVKDIRGHKLFIESVEKEGHEYSRVQNPSTSFLYTNGSRDAFAPDAKNPVVFVLRKMNTPTLVLPSEISGQVRYGKQYFCELQSGYLWSSEDTLRKQNVRQKKDLIVEAAKDGKGEWVLTVRTIADQDGLLIGNREFTAPESGYNKEVKIRKQEIENTFETCFVFCKLDDGKKYGRLDVRINDSDDSVTMRGNIWINPSGERNLEYSEDIYQKYIEEQNR